jgi:hypothetical protein
MKSSLPTCVGGRFRLQQYCVQFVLQTTAAILKLAHKLNTSKYTTTLGMYRFIFTYAHCAINNDSLDVNNYEQKKQTHAANYMSINYA